MGRKIIILGTAHLSTTPGKCSPDGKFKEYAFSRKVAESVADILDQKGYSVFIDYMSNKPCQQMKGSDWKQEQSRELSYRKDFVNSICKKFGKDKCIYVSIHVDAAGNGSKWMEARGFSVRVSPKASEESRKLARCLYGSAQNEGPDVTGNRAVPKEKYWVQNLYILNETVCPAVLTENLFQDNVKDVGFLMSEKGYNAIVNLHVNGIVEYMENND